MADDDTMKSGGLPGDEGPVDPLGVIGWEIGGKYKIESYIGGGGFGEVYFAHNVNLIEQRLVVKFFKRVQARDRFDREAKILCLLDHPHISRVVDYLPDEGALVIQYIDGQDCAEILREKGPLPAATFRRVAQAITSAIAYAHQQKIAHRDLKPGNIIIDKNGHAYLIDFGIAKEMGSDATRTGYQSLTPMFAAPERQTGGRDYNPFLSDIYELGITLFNLATNSMPYRNPVAPRISEWGGEATKGLSSDLLRILRKATHPDPAERYRSADAMAKDCNELERVYDTPAGKRWLLYAAIAVVVLIAAFLGRNQISALFTSGPSEQVAVVSPDSSGLISPPLDSSPPPAVSEIADIGPVETEMARTEPELAVAEEMAEREEMAVVEEAPPSPALRVRVRPDGLHRLFIDGRSRTLGRRYEVAEGDHDIELIHPDYPVLRRRVAVIDPETQMDFDLASEYAATDTLSLQLALNPYSDDHLLELTANGRELRFTQFPALDLHFLSGEWQFKIDIQPVNSDTPRNSRVDSCVTFPFGGGPRNVIIGAEGSILLQAGDNGSVVPLLVFWSE